MKIIFVCSSNVSRSVIAEAIAKDKVQKDPALAGVEIDSAGISIWGGGDPRDPGSRAVCERHGLETFPDGRAKRLSGPEADSADHIYVVNPLHAYALKNIVPECGDKIESLIPDEEVISAVGESDAMYDQCYKQIEAAIDARIEEWKKEL